MERKFGARGADVISSSLHVGPKGSESITIFSLRTFVEHQRSSNPWRSQYTLLLWYSTTSVVFFPYVVSNRPCSYHLLYRDVNTWLIIILSNRNTFTRTHDRMRRRQVRFVESISFSLSLAFELFHHVLSDRGTVGMDQNRITVPSRSRWKPHSSPRPQRSMPLRHNRTLRSVFHPKGSMRINFRTPDPSHIWRKPSPHWCPSAPSTGCNWQMPWPRLTSRSIRSNARTR